VFTSSGATFSFHCAKGRPLKLHDSWLLLVEDSTSDRELTLMALTRGRAFPHRVQTAQDGVEALDLLFCRGAHSGRDRSDRPRVVLLDVNMPLMNGLEVLREIKAAEDMRVVPVVMLTSSAEQRDLATSYALGANSYVVKPVDIDEFFSTVHEVGRYWLGLNQPGEEVKT
jgi:two-component system, response regulator